MPGEGNRKKWISRDNTFSDTVAPGWFSCDGKSRGTIPRVSLPLARAGSRKKADCSGAVVPVAVFLMKHYDLLSPLDNKHDRLIRMDSSLT